MRTSLRWLPATTLLLIFVLLWATAASGGTKGVVSWLTLMTVLPVVGGLTVLGLVVLVIRRRRTTAPLLVTFVVSLLLIWPYFWQNWRLGHLAMAYPITLENTRPIATVRLPVDEPILVGMGGDNPRVNYHVTDPDQRWAYDLMVEPAFSMSSQVKDYGCWRVPVLAPAAGEVVMVHDGEPDHIAGWEAEGLGISAGNTVSIRLETDTYLLIGHLQQGSIVVREGQQVAEGQVLGRCGNSGLSAVPHIHIHHQRQDPRTVRFGLVEGLPLYFRDHDGQPMPQGGVRVEDGNVIALGDRVQHVGK